jgi:ribosomal protein S12 methylthiotransferase accessory factor
MLDSGIQLRPIPYPAPIDDRRLLPPATLRHFGITRVGDVTGLDTIGLPVWFASRPNARSLTVSQGKGLTDGQARLSAVMEAIEGAVAEQTKELVCRFASIGEICHSAKIVPFVTLARVQPALIDRDRQRAWIHGHSAVSGEPVLAPYELIGLDMRSDFPWDRAAFHMTSQGLAAAFDFDRAVLHALLEIIEQDASFAVDMFDTEPAPGSRLRYRPREHPGLDAVMVRLSQAGVHPALYDITGPVGIPTVIAIIPRPVNSRAGPIQRNSTGIACRLDINEAAAAALLEAVQSRLTDIAGARDDLPEERYVQSAGRLRQPAWPQACHFADRFVLSEPPCIPLWRQVVGHLAASGGHDVFIFPLPTGIDGIFVVRVLVTGLAASSGALDNFSVSALASLLKAQALE